MQHLLLSFIALIMTPCTYAQTPEYNVVDGKKIYFTRWGYGAKIISGEEEYEGDVRIPETVTYTLKVGNTVHSEIWKVVAIDGAFEGDKVTSVYVPPTVTELWGGAFFHCGELKSVELSEGLKTIHTYAFNICPKLESVVIPASVSEINVNRPIFNCRGLTSIAVKEGNAFYDSRDDCNAIIETASNKLIKGCKTTHIPDGVVTIGAEGFAYQDAPEYLKIPSSVKKIEAVAFQDCLGLKHLEIEEGLDTIASGVFKRSTLVEFNIPASVRRIESSAFQYCDSLQSISIHPDNPFYDSRNDCNAIIVTASDSLIIGCRNTVIPENVRVIGERAFQNQPIKSLTLPASIESIGKRTFYFEIDTIVSYIKKPFEVDNTAFLPFGVLIVPNGTKELYQNTPGWEFPEIIEMGEIDKPTPCAAWCADNATLYFFTDHQVPAAGDTHDGRTITNLWSGAEVTDTGNEAPLWKAVVADKVIRVVFEESFANVRPTSTCRWFNGDVYLRRIDGMEFLNTSEVTNMHSMFSNCQRLPSVELSHFTTSKVTDMAGLFYNCHALESIDVSTFDTGNVTDMLGMFDGCGKVKHLDISNFNTEKVTDLSLLFYECKSMETVNLEGLNTSSATNMAHMFFGCGALKSLDIRHFDTSHVTNMRTMFGGCSALTSIDLSTWNTEKVNNMRSMFYLCKSLTEVNLSGFDTSKTSSMSLMFYDCEELTSLNLASFSSKNLVTSDSMFYACDKLKAVYVGPEWKEESIVASTDMFYDCVNMKGSNGTTFDAHHTDALYARIDNQAQQGYFRGADKVGEVITATLRLRCSKGGWLIYKNQKVTNGSAYFEVPFGEDVLIEAEAEKGYSLVSSPSVSMRPTYSVGYGGNNRCYIYGMNQNAVVSAEFEMADGIGEVAAEKADDTSWYTLQGFRLNSQPTTPGIYLHGGRKVVVQ